MGYSDSEVVADPRVTFGRGVYLNLTGRELDAAVKSLGVLGISVGASLCTLDDKLPGIWGRVAKLMCNALPFATFQTLTNLLGSQVVSPQDYDKCYQTRLGEGRWNEVSLEGNCRS